tara:strand:+ start:39 stop:569 length:531 start_codon:yes stop_codon:yes gene_type:complete
MDSFFCRLFFSFILVISCFSLAKEDVIDWKVSSVEDLIRYEIHGTVVFGHKFGLLKYNASCNRKFLWLSWSSTDKSVSEFKGQDVVIKFTVGEVSFQTEVPLLSVNQIPPITTVMAFTNFIMGDKFIALLEQGSEIEVQIISPESLVSKLDIRKDRFSLDGFTIAQTESNKLCQAQ